MLVFIVSLMGMAVDAGVLFAIRARLGAAADSAALAAGRGVNLGATASEANAKAAEAAMRFLKANFPDGYLGIDSAQTQLKAEFALQTHASKPTGILEIKVRAQVAAPVYFMKFWGVSTVPVTVEGRATRRNLVLMMVLDKSASMGSRFTEGGTLPATAGPNVSACEGMVFAAGQMPDFFSPYDHLGMVSYHDTAFVDFPATSGFKGAGAGGLKQKIGQLACGNSNNTNTTAGLEAAYQEIQRIDQKQALNVILLFTDGVPNGVNASFPLRTAVDTRLGPAEAESVPASHPDRTNCLDGSGTKECTNMPVACSNGMVTGVIAQQAGLALSSGARAGLFRSFPGDELPSFAAGCPSSGTKLTSQTIAYIPRADRFGNSTHGPKDNWAFQVNQQCAPTDAAITAGNARCKNIGGEWSNFSRQWAGQSPGTNFFTAGPYAGSFRPDHANAIAAVSMNTAINEALRIRSDPNYRVRIGSIYLQGNGQDPVDREFLPMMANLDAIPALVYEREGTPEKPNPLYNPSQAQGYYWQSANVQELGGIFADAASSLLRLTQ